MRNRKTRSGPAQRRRDADAARRLGIAVARNEGRAARRGAPVHARPEERPDSMLWRARTPRRAPERDLLYLAAATELEVRVDVACSRARGRRQRDAQRPGDACRRWGDDPDARGLARVTTRPSTRRLHHRHPRAREPSYEVRPRSRSPKDSAVGRAKSERLIGPNQRDDASALEARACDRSAPGARRHPIARVPT